MLGRTWEYEDVFTISSEEWCKPLAWDSRDNCIVMSPYSIKQFDPNSGCYLSILPTNPTKYSAFNIWD